MSPDVCRYVARWLAVNLPDPKMRRAAQRAMEMARKVSDLPGWLRTP